SGNTTVNAGTLAVSKAGAVGGGTQLTLAAASLEATNTFTYPNTLMANGASSFIVDSPNSLTLSGTLSNTSSSDTLTISGGGTVILTGANNYTGTINVKNGNITI